VSPREPATRPLPGGTPGSLAGAGESGDLFTGKPIARSGPARRRRLAPELTAARVLCRRLARNQARQEKQRIVHLICLNLRAILNRPSQGS
jgi:hypothetical protein